jgi:hypothetical protein
LYFIQRGLRASASIMESRPSAELRITLIRHSLALSPVTTCSPKGGSPSVSSCFKTGATSLHCDRAGDGLNDARELDQDSITGRLYDPAFVLGDLWINQFAVPTPSMTGEHRRVCYPPPGFGRSSVLRCCATGRLLA